MTSELIQQEVEIKLLEFAPSIINKIIDNANKPIRKDHRSRILDEYKRHLGFIELKLQESFITSDVNNHYRPKLLMTMTILRNIIDHIELDAITDSKITYWKRSLSNFGFEHLVSELYLLTPSEIKYDD